MKNNHKVNETAATSRQNLLYVYSDEFGGNLFLCPSSPIFSRSMVKIMGSFRILFYEINILKRVLLVYLVFEKMVNKVRI
jgi:hypothetical protein